MFHLHLPTYKFSFSSSMNLLALPKFYNASSTSFHFAYSSICHYKVLSVDFVFQELTKDFLKRSFETDELLGHSHAWLDHDNYRDTTFDLDIARLEYAWSEVRDKLSSLAR